MDELPKLRTLRLKDLNDDCLIKIFRSLSLNDLVRIVDFDERFTAAAKYVFGRRFGKKPFKMDKFWYNKTEMIRARTLSMLNHFGEVITHLHLTYEDLIAPNEDLGSVLIAKCRKSLVKIVFSGTSQSIIPQLIEPFENVQAVSFEHGVYCDLISQFNKWFPKADTLSLREIKLSADEKVRLFQQNYPAVKHFTFIEPHTPSIDINDFAELNPQLISLSISPPLIHAVDWSDLLEVIAKNLPNLQTFEWFELIEQSYELHQLVPNVVVTNNNANGKIVNIFFADKNTANLINLVAKWSDLKELIFPYKSCWFESEAILKAVFDCESLEKLSVGYRHPTTYTIFSENYTTVQRALDDAVAVNGNKWKTNVTFETSKLRRFDYLINFDRVTRKLS